MDKLILQIEKEIKDTNLLIPSVGNQAYLDSLEWVLVKAKELQNKELAAAYALVLDDLTDANAHTLAALVDHFYNGTGGEIMAKAYDSARQVLAAKND